MNPTRRSILWSAPVISVAVAAPAFAKSPLPDPIPDCAPVGCKKPGLGKNTKDYYVRTKHRDDVVVLAVLIGGRAAYMSDHGWETRGFKNSRAKRDVVVTYTLASNPGKNLQWSGEVSFPPCKDY